MAGRDINIPTGPDKSGRITIPEVIQGAGAPADQTIAQPPISTADLRGLDVEGSQIEPNQVDAWLSKPMDAVPDPAIAAAEPVSAADTAAMQANDVAFANATPEPIVQADGAADTSGLEVFTTAGADTPVEAEASEEIEEADKPAEEEAEAAEADGASQPQAINDVAASLGALRDSIGQGRELKAREKDREELAEKIQNDSEELADRDDILANYAAIIAEQDRIIAENTQKRDAWKAELSHVVAQTEETSEALSRMRDYNDVQLQPYETALGRAQATADQAKNDERSRKSELNAAESEVRRAEKSDDATTEKARLDVAKAAYDEAVARSNAAKEALEEAQRNYDSLKEQVEQAEAPLENALDDLEKQSEQLKENIARLGDAISAASKRRQYCDSVYQYPAETEKLRQTVASDEAALDRLDAENDALRNRLAESKAKSTKAKILIAAVGVFVIVLICLFWFLSSR